MNIEQMQLKLKSLGLKKTYFPHWDHEARAGKGTIILQMRKNVVIHDGKLVLAGMIDLYDDHFFRVWTPRKQLGNKLAKQHNLRVRNDLMDEIEVFIPFSLCDLLLHPLGARVKKQYSQATIEASRARMASLRSKT